MSRLGLLASIVLVAALALGALARGGVFPRLREERAPAPMPDTTVAVAWRDGRLAPAHLRIPKNRKVTLEVTAEEAEKSPGYLSVAGYEQDLGALYLRPGVTVRARFVSDRPGDGFEIRLGDRVVGRLDVTGEHLEETGP